MPQVNKVGQQFGEMRHPIDVDALNTYLKQNVPDIAAPVHVKQFTYGQSNPTYVLFDQNKTRYVLRKKPPGELISETAHAVEREYRILKALGTFTASLPGGITHPDAVPVPNVYCLCEDKSIVGTNFYIMQFIEGRIFADYRMLELPKHERTQCWYSAMRTLAALHRLTPGKIGLEKYGKPADFYARQIKLFGGISKMQAMVEDEKTGKLVGPIPGIDEFLKWFKENVPNDENTLIHGDYKIDNIIFHPTEPRVIGLLDWELSTRGHPLSDLANMLQPFSLPASSSVLANSPDGFFEAQKRGELLLLLGGLSEADCPIPTKDQLLQVYCKAAGRPYPIDRWASAEAWAWFRLALITQGIAARNAQGQASSAQAAVYGSKFPICADAMFRIVETSQGKPPRALSKI